MAYFFGKIFSTYLLFPISEAKFSVAEISKNNFRKKNFLKTIFEDFILFSKLETIEL